jgi:hypothetical protein
MADSKTVGKPLDAKNGGWKRQTVEVKRKVGVVTLTGVELSSSNLWVAGRLKERCPG